jgi:hypothetical protein
MVKQKLWQKKTNDKRGYEIIFCLLGLTAPLFYDGKHRCIVISRKNIRQRSQKSFFRSPSPKTLVAGGGREWVLDVVGVGGRQDIRVGRSVSFFLWVVGLDVSNRAALALDVSNQAQMRQRKTKHQIVRLIVSNRSALLVQHHGRWVSQAEILP